MCVSVLQKRDVLSADQHSACVLRMLDDFSHELDSTQSRLDNVMKKLAKVSHMTSGRSWEVGTGPGKGETSPWIFRLGHCAPTHSAKAREQLSVLERRGRLPSPAAAPAQTLLCCRSLAFVLFTDAFLFMLLLLGKSPSSWWEGKLCSLLLCCSFPGCLWNKSCQGAIKHRPPCVASPHQNACSNPLPKSHLPWGCWRLQACCPSHLLSAGRGKG